MTGLPAGRTSSFVMHHNNGVLMVLGGVGNYSSSNTEGAPKDIK